VSTDKPWYACQFQEAGGNPHIASRLRHFDGKIWYVKGPSPLDHLGYLLARGRLNVCETAFASEDSGLDPATALVRPGQTYSLSELPIQDLDEAVASELVFSLWIRRRDTHAFNRVYVDGIPVFFDFNAAFDAEVINADPDGFFRAGNLGFVQSWRVVPAEELVRDTDQVRHLGNARSLALHVIHDTEVLYDHLDAWVAAIREMKDETIVRALEEARISQERCSRIRELLRRSQDVLPQMASRLQPILGASGEFGAEATDNRESRQKAARRP
jgi:hypothetical protein